MRKRVNNRYAVGGGWLEGLNVSLGNVLGNLPAWSSPEVWSRIMQLCISQTTSAHTEAHVLPVASQLQPAAGTTSPQHPLPNTGTATVNEVSTSSNKCTNSHPQTVQPQPQGLVGTHMNMNMTSTRATEACATSATKPSSEAMATNSVGANGVPALQAQHRDGVVLHSAMYTLARMLSVTRGGACGARRMLRTVCQSIPLQKASESVCLRDRTVAVSDAFDSAHSHARSRLPNPSVNAMAGECCGMTRHAGQVELKMLVIYTLIGHSFGYVCASNHVHFG